MKYTKQFVTQAVRMRRAGATYSEILEEIPVAKSTLSLWLRDVGIAKKQQQRLSEKKLDAQRRGGARRKEIRIQEQNLLLSQGLEKIGAITDRELMLLGAALYWAEGTKIKEYRPSVRMEFSNSDPEMIAFFMLWLRKVLNLKNQELALTIYLHTSHEERLKEITRFWLAATGLSSKELRKPVFKLHKPSTKRRNAGDTYKGLVKITVRNSAKLNRLVNGWIYGIISSRNCRIV